MEQFGAGSWAEGVEALLESGVPTARVRSAVLPGRWIAVRPLDGETVQEAFVRAHPQRSSHYWFDTDMADDEGSWVMPRFGGTLTEEHLEALAQVGAPHASVTWARSAG